MGRIPGEAPSSVLGACSSYTQSAEVPPAPCPLFPFFQALSPQQSPSGAVAAGAKTLRK